MRIIIIDDENRLNVVEFIKTTLTGSLNIPESTYYSVETLKKELEKIKKELGEDVIKNTDTEKILNYFGCKTQKNADNKLIIERYKQPKLFTYQDIGISENKMFKDIYKIETTLDLRNSAVTNLGNLEYIDGNLFLSDSQVINLGNLKTVKGSVEFANSKLENTGKLKNIKGSANFGYSSIKNIDSIEYIDGNAWFGDSKITELKNLKIIGKNADFNGSQITKLGNLEKIGGNANFNNSQIRELENLEKIDGNADFYNSPISNLGKLKAIGKELTIDTSKKNLFKNIKAKKVKCYDSQEPLDKLSYFQDQLQKMLDKNKHLLS